MKRQLSGLCLFILCLLLFTSQRVHAADNIIQNPGFESGASSWTEYSSGGYKLIYETTTGRGNNGSNEYVNLGGYNDADEYIYQDITIPVGATSATLEFYYNITTTESPTDDYDFLFIKIADPPASTTPIKVASLSNRNSTSGWAKSASINLSAYKGKTVRLFFIAVTDGTSTTEFLLDDVNLTVAQETATKRGDCDFDGTVTIAEVQSAINMFLGIKPVAGCVDTGKDNSVSIAEVQSVINAFLGIGVPTQATVPDLLNKSQSASQTLLAAAGLSLGTITQTSNSTVPAGSISSQSPASGVAVARGTAVNLVISSGALLPDGFSVTIPIGGVDGGRTVALTTASTTVAAAVVEIGETLVSPGVTVQVTGEESVTGNGTNSLVFPVSSPTAAANPDRVFLKVRLTTGVVLPVSGVYDPIAKTFTAELPGLTNGWTMAVVVNPSLQTHRSGVNKSLAKRVYGWITPIEWETFDWEPVYDPALVTKVDVDTLYLPSLVTASQTLAAAGFRSPKLWVDSRYNPKARIVHIMVMPKHSHYLSSEDPKFSEVEKTNEEMLKIGQMYIDPLQLADLKARFNISLDNIVSHELSHACQMGYDIRRTATSFKAYSDGMATFLGQTYQETPQSLSGPDVFVRALHDGEYAFLNRAVGSPEKSFYRQQDFFAYVTKRYAAGSFAWFNRLLEQMGLDTTGQFNLTTEQLITIYRGSLDTTLQNRFSKSLAKIYREYALDRAYEHSATAILRTTETALEGFAPNTLARKLFLITPNDAADPTNITEAAGLKELSALDANQTALFPALPPLSTGAVKIMLPIFVPPVDNPNADPPPFSFSVKLEGGNVSPTRDDAVKIMVYYEDNKETMLPGGMVEISDVSKQITIPGRKGANFLTVLIMNCNVTETTIKATITLGPYIENINPNPATLGANVTLTGSGFGAIQGTSTLKLGTAELTDIVNWSDSEIVFRLRSSDEAGKLQVTVNGVTSNEAELTLGGMLGNWVMTLNIEVDYNEPACAAMPSYWHAMNIYGNEVGRQGIPVYVSDNGNVTLSYQYTSSFGGNFSIKGTGTYLADPNNFSRPTLRIAGSWTASKTTLDPYDEYKIITQSDSGTFSGSGYQDTIIGAWWGKGVTANYSSSIRYVDKDTDKSNSCSVTINPSPTFSDILDFRIK